MTYENDPVEIAIRNHYHDRADHDKKYEKLCEEFKIDSCGHSDVNQYIHECVNDDVYPDIEKFCVVCKKEFIDKKLTSIKLCWDCYEQSDHRLFKEDSDKCGTFGKCNNAEGCDKCEYFGEEK